MGVRDVEGREEVVVDDLLALPVAQHVDVLAAHRPRHGAGEVRDEEPRALQDRDEDDVAVAVVVADPPAHVRDASGDVLGAVELVGDKSHRRASLAGGPRGKDDPQGREYSSITRAIARRQTGQKPPGSRVNMMQSTDGR